MKKLLILLSLTTAMTAFGAPQGNSETNYEMGINARVIVPLRVEVADMEFGDIIQDYTANATGTYTITGEPNQDILFTLEKPDFLLSADNSENLAITFDYEPLPTKVDSSGSTTVNIIGTLSPTLIHSGNYSGTIVGKIQYN